MPAPTNQTPETALVIGLDYTFTLQDVDLAIQELCETWWSYTGVAGDLMVGFYATSSWQNVVTAWTGPTSSLTPYENFTDAEDEPATFRIVDGETVYFRVRNDSGAPLPTGSTVTISALRGPALTAPVGSILIPADFGPWPAMLGAGDGTVYQYKDMISHGEGGDVLASGAILHGNALTSLVRYSNQLVAEETIPWVSTATHPAIRTHVPTQKWYVSRPGASDTTIFTVAADGTIGGTTWVLPSATVHAIAVNNAETILYYTVSALGAAVFRWNLTLDSALSDFVAGVGGARAADLLVLASDDVLVAYNATPMFIRRYNPAATLITSYALTANPNVDDPRVATALDNPTSFWAKYNDTVTGNGGPIVNFDTAATTRTFDADFATYDGDYRGPAASLPDVPRFGRFTSCPLIITRVSIPGTGSPTPTPPGPEGESSAFRHISPFRRRQRVFPHLSEEQIYAFHKALQIDMETGVGLGDPDDPEAYNPQAMLDWSDDGGHTWSNVHNKTLGKMGEYKHRVMYRMLGRSRDRIYRLTLSDPVRAYVIAGYLDAEAGVS